MARYRWDDMGKFDMGQCFFGVGQLIEKPRVENDEFYEHYAFADDDDYYDTDPEQGSDEWWELRRDECGWFEDTCLQAGTEYCDFKCAMRSIYEDEAESVSNPPYGDLGIGGSL